MSKKEKLIARIKTRPRDFTFEEASTLLAELGFQMSNKGKTSGSRTMFVSPDHPQIMLHKPHPRNTLAVYQIKQLLEFLEQEKLI